MFRYSFRKLCPGEGWVRLGGVQSLRLARGDAVLLLLSCEPFRSLARDVAVDLAKRLVEGLGDGSLPLSQSPVDLRFGWWSLDGRGTPTSAPAVAVLGSLLVHAFLRHAGGLSVLRPRGRPMVEMRMALMLLFTHWSGTDAFLADIVLERDVRDGGPGVGCAGGEHSWPW